MCCFECGFGEVSWSSCLPKVHKGQTGAESLSTQPLGLFWCFPSKLSLFDLLRRLGIGVLKGIFLRAVHEDDLKDGVKSYPHRGLMEAFPEAGART